MKIILMNVVYLFCSNILIKILTALSTFIVARYLGAEEYGELSVLIALSTVLSSLLDLGLINTTIREGTKKNSKIDLVISSFFNIRIILFCFLTVVFLLYAFCLYNGNVLALLLITIPTLIGQLLQGVAKVYYQIKEEMKNIAIINIIIGILTPIFIFVAIYLKLSLNFIAFSYGLTSLLAGIICIVIVQKKYKYTVIINKSILVGIHLFTINALLYTIIPQLGPIILEKILSLQDVGYFSAAYRIPSYLYVIPGIVATAFYPRLFKLYNQGEFAKHSNLSKIQIKIMTTITSIVTMPFIFFSTIFITILFGEEWLVLENYVPVLCLVVILQSFNYPLADYLTTKGHQDKRLIALSISFFIGVTSYIYLGVKYGLSGVIYAPIMLEVSYLLILSYFTKSHRLFVVNRLIKLSVMFGILNYLQNIIDYNAIIEMVTCLVVSIFIMFILDLKYILQLGRGFKLIYRK